MSRRVTSPVIVGRDAELAEMMAALQAAVSGAGGLLIVEGEAGIGKSRLIDEFVARATATGALALAGSCLPFADAVPFAPLAAIFDHLPDGGRAVADPAGIEPADRFRFFRWVADELIKLAASQPVIVAVEDLHWADESTGDLLLYVANAVRTSPVLVVASRRPAERHHPTGLGAALGELVRSGRAQRLIVLPLDRDDVGTMIGQILGVDPSPGLLERVVGRSDGNPFFAEELVAAGGGDDLPTMVGDVIRQRVARLDETTQQLLRLAAAIGRRVSHALLSEVATIDGSALDAALRDAVGHQLLVAAGDHYSFRHALGHEAVYRDILPGERAALHERIAVALTGRPELALGGDHAVAAAELAHHWHAAGRLSKSLAASVLAGQAAEATNAPIEAHVHFRRAIELWSRVDEPAATAGVDRIWLLEHAAESSSLAGSHHGAVQLVDQLLAEVDPELEPERHARILVRRALYLWYAGDATTSRQATAELRERAEAGLTLAAVARLCAVANQSSLELRYVDALTLARDAMGAATQVGAQADVGFALHILGSLESHLGCYDAAIERLQQSLAISREGADSQRVGSTWHNLAEAYVYAGRPSEAVAVAESGIVELQRLGLSRTFAALTAGQLTFALLALGRWDEADRCSRDVIAGEAQPYFAVPVKLGRLHVLVRQGRFDDVEALLADLRENFGGYDYMAGVCALWEAELAVWQHDWQRARSSLERSYAVTATTDEIGLELRLVVLAVRLEADQYAWSGLTAAPRDRTAAQAAADGRIRQAEEFLARIETVTGCCSLPFRRLLELAYAERGRLDERAAPAAWAEIAGRAGHDTYLAAYAHWREADALLTATARPDRAYAQSLVRSAYAGATELGAVPLSSAIADLAMRARIELVLAVQDAAIGGQDGDADALGLTRRELEVLRLLGDGLSNREIGEALYISAKTASVHVTHILQKLNVTTRVQAALAADRLAGHSVTNSVVK